MRWSIWVFAAAVIGAAGPAAGYQPGCASCNGGATKGPWGAEACATPAGYCLVPGCCEDTRHCCDNAWAGYCDHRAKVDAFWARVGVPGSCGRPRPCRPGAMTPSSPCNAYPTGTIQPMPAVPSPVPAAAPSPPSTPDSAGRSNMGSKRI